MTKVTTLIGFANKAGKLIFGVDNIERRSKSISLVICDETLSKNSLKIMKALQIKNPDLQILIFKTPLSEVVYKKNTKAIAVTDRQMAQAILKNIDSGCFILNINDQYD